MSPAWMGGFGLAMLLMAGFIGIVGGFPKGTWGLICLGFGGGVSIATAIWWSRAGFDPTRPPKREGEEG
jgi:hypothetical protein